MVIAAQLHKPQPCRLQLFHNTRNLRAHAYIAAKSLVAFSRTALPFNSFTSIKDCCRNIYVVNLCFYFILTKQKRFIFFYETKKNRNRLQRVLQQGNYPRKASPFPRLEVHCNCNDEREHTSKDIRQSAVLHSAHHRRDKDI